MTVSVVIPVYDLEAYIGDCLRSVLGQTYADLDVVVVDDGSSDGSVRVCKEVAARDGRVRVFEVGHAGQAHARNVGLSQTAGDAVVFVDGDDVVSPLFVETLLTGLDGDECDIAAVPCGTAFADGEDPRLVQDGEALARLGVRSEQIAPADYQRMLAYQRVECGATYRMYRRALLGDMPFPDGLVYEDLATTYRFARKARRIRMIWCERLYGYRQRMNGTMAGSYEHNKARSAVEVSDRMYDDVSRWYPGLAAGAASRCFSVCRVVYARIPHGEVADRRLVWSRLARYRATVLLDREARRRERAAAAVAHLGPHAFSAFCRIARMLGLLR